MKNISFIGTTRSQTLLIKDSTTYLESTFQGFTILPTVTAHYTISNALEKGFECSFSKASKIRYHNIGFFTEMIKSEAIKISNEEFEQSKVFSAQEKKVLKQVEVDEQICNKIKQNFNNFVDDQYLLREAFSKKQKIQNASIVSFNQELLIKIQEKEKPSYISLTLKNIDHYFLLFPNLQFAPHLANYKNITLNIEKVKYNLVKRKFQLQATLPENIEIDMLERGWGTLTVKNMIFLKDQSLGKYRQAEEKARKNNRGIFKKPFQILSFIYSKNNILATIHEVIQGYIYKVRTKTGEMMKIQLSMVYCPILNELGAFECRQFARKNLIGKQVNIFLKKDEGLNIQGSFVRMSDNKDIESLILQNGYGFVKEELKGSLISAKFQNIEKKARQKKKGIHEQTQLGQRNFEDLTMTFSKKDKLRKKDFLETKLKFLRQVSQNEEGIIDKPVTASTYIVRINSMKKIIKVKLDGVKTLKANPRLPQIQELNENINKFLVNQLFQRTVMVEINDYDQIQNCFLGVLRMIKKGKERNSLQEILLNEGFLFIDKNNYYEQSWLQSEQRAEKENRNIWGKNLKQLKKFSYPDKPPKQFNGRFSWIKDGETAYVQPQFNFSKLQNINNSLSKKLAQIDQKDFVVGYLCAAPFFEEYYRAKIIAIEKTVTVEFIDWGNREQIQAKQLRKIEDELQYIPPLCVKVCLDIVKKYATNTEHLERIREYMMEGDCQFVTLYGNVVNVYRQKNSLNMCLIEEGYLKAELSKIHDEKFRMKVMQIMDSRRKELVGIWDLEEEDIEASDSYGY